MDDVYILADYARHWVATGRLEWTTGERVEGYSSLVSVALAALLHVLGLAPELALKGIAGASVVAIAVIADRVCERSWAGTAALFGLLLASPTVRWSVDGMDAPLFALVLTGGWLTVTRARPGVGLALLGLAALVRPEGMLHLAVAGALVVLQVGWRRAVMPVFATIFALVAYHSLRTAWFGEFVPTPTLLKIVATPASLYGLRQGVLEAAPYVGALLLLARRPTLATAIAMIPMLLQIAVVTRSSGDWMAGGRLVMPGAIATAVLLAAIHRDGTSVSPLRQALAGVLALLGVALLPAAWGAVGAEWQPLPTVSRLAGGTNRGLVTPLPEDVAWIVEHVPDGRCVLVNDVGMVGGIPGICVLDLRGLVTRASAEAAAEGRQEEWFGELLASESRPYAVRQAWWGGEPQDVPEWLVRQYSSRLDLRYPGGTVGWFAETEASLALDEIAKRWRALAEQHPDHPWIAWRAAIAAVNADDGELAHALARSAAARWPAVDMVADDASRWSFVGGDVPLEWEAGRGFVLVGSGMLETRPVDCLADRLRVESTDLVDVEIESVATDTSVSTALDGKGGTLAFPGCGGEGGGEGRYRVRVVGAGAGTRTILRVVPR
ncbi:hypothetical protein LBMAG42_51160 [Deltaproteobacteria bacterium]|nr:hypothetical protein LBMAG42_51160 [Deltaproteobacteria bacterium]